MLFYIQNTDFDGEHVSQHIFKTFYAAAQKLTEMARNNQLPAWVGYDVMKVEKTANLRRYFIDLRNEKRQVIMKVVLDFDLQTGSVTGWENFALITGGL